MPQRATRGFCVIIATAVALSALAAWLVVQQPELLNLSGVASPRGLTLLVAALALGAVCLSSPDVALCCLVAFVYLNLSDVLVRAHGLPSVLQLSFVPLALAGWWNATPRAWLPPRVLTLLLSGYLVIILCSTTLAADRAAADQRLLEHLRGLAIFSAVVMLARSGATLRRGIWTMVACASLLGGLALFQVLTGNSTGDLGGLGRIKYAHIHGNTFEPRIAGPIGDPNFFAQILLLAVPFALGLAFTERRMHRRALAFGAAGLASTATVFTYSRGGALALAVVVVLSVAARGISLRTASLGALPLVALLWVVLPDDFAHRLTTLSQLLPGSDEVLHPDSSFGERRLFTAAAWRMFEEYPVLGIGVGNYGFHFPEYAQQVGSDARLYVTPVEGYYPHNLYLEVAAETGVVGFLVFTAALTACFAYLWRARLGLRETGEPASAHLAIACAIALGGYLLSSLFLHGHFIRYWWLLAGFTAAFHNLGNSRHSASEQRAVESPTAARNGEDVRVPEHGVDAIRPTPCPAVRPVVAVIVSRFPLVTETFILREIIEMERQGQPVLLVPLLKETPAVVHREAEPWTKRALYSPFFSIAILQANARMLRRRPLRYAHVLGRIAIGTIASPNFLVRSLALFPKAVFLAERLEHEGIRHLHAHYATHPATVALIAASLTQMTFSFTVHAHDIFVRRALLRWKLQAAAFVRSISRFNRAYLADRYPDALVQKIHVIHVGIEPATYGPPIGQRFDARCGRPAGIPRLLCVASLRPYKGIPVLLDACGLLKDRGLTFTCTIVGEGPQRPELEARLDRLGLAQIVTLAGARPQDEVAMLMRTASLLVMPSIVAPDGQMEGIPVAVMEAMAARLPIVASSLSGIPELVEHGTSGLLVKPGSASELAGAIERILSDSHTSRRMGVRARAMIEREFRLDASVHALLERVAPHNPPPSRAHGLRSMLGPVAGHRPIGIRRLQERRDSRIAQVIVPNGRVPHEVTVKIHRSRPGESQPAAERARREFELLHTLSRASTNGSRVPRPLQLHAQCVVMESCEGEPLDALIRTRRLSREGPAQRELAAALSRSGQWLRHFQESAPSEGHAGSAVDRLVESARLELGRARGVLLHTPAAMAVVSQLDALRAQLAPASLRVIRTHGDFWPGNVFVGREAVEVIDFEGAGAGLPYEDVAYFLVQLELFFPGPILRRRFASLAAAFLGGYLPAEQSFDWPAYEMCRIASALRIHNSRPGWRNSLQDRWRRRMLRAIVVGGAA